MNYKVLLVLLVATLPFVEFVTPAFASTYQPMPSAVAALPGYKKVESLPPDYPLLVTVYIPLSNTGLLYSMVQQVSNPSSPQYEHFLTYSQIQKLFLPVGQYNQVISYLKGKGFRILLMAMDSTILIQGTVQQVKQYLGLSTALYSNGTYSYYTLVGNPNINAFV